MADKTPDRDPEQENLFKEIDEELRQENYAVLWKKYGNYVIGLAAALVLGVAAFQGYNAWDASRRGSDSAQFNAALKALQSDNADQAASILAGLANNGSGGYAVLARFNQANLLARQGNKTAGADTYLAIANDSSVDQLLRDLARLLSALHEIDTGDPALLADRLAPLAQPQSAWRFTANELLALLARRTGDTNRARELFRQLADDANAPPGIRARAAEMIAIIGG